MGRSDAKGMDDIYRDLEAAGKGIHAPQDASAQDPRADRMWSFEVRRDGRVSQAYISTKHNAVWVNVGDLSSGDAGGAIYQMAGAYARNNGKVLVGDPDGITEAGKRRRLENMIALALKYDSVDFLQPHRDMLGWNGLQWMGGFDNKHACHANVLGQSYIGVSSRSQGDHV